MIIMNKPKPLKRGERVAIVSLSSGILGEPFCAHQRDLGVKRLESLGLVPVWMEHTLKGTEYLKNHPEARAKDLKDAFFDGTIKGIICAIGGDDTYRLLPYLIDDEAFLAQVKKTPKLFTGFSDTTNNHLLFHKLGMTSYYGPNFLSDLAELGPEMLPVTKKAFQSFFGHDIPMKVESSPVWYEERTDFSAAALGTPRVSHVEMRGYERVYGHGLITGHLFGGCLESLYDAYTGTRYPEQRMMYERYGMMPETNAWKEFIFFIETSEEQPTPDLFETYISEFAQRGILGAVKAMIVGKPQNEAFYEAYKGILSRFGKIYDTPMLMNVNFGHAYPRIVLPYGLKTSVDLDQRTITVLEPMFAAQ